MLLFNYSLIGVFKPVVCAQLQRPMKYLKGNLSDGANNLSHGCINTLIGIPIVIVLILGLAYLYFIIFA